MWTFNYFSEIYDQKFRLGIFPLGVYLPTMLRLGEKSQVQKPRSCFSVLFLSFLNDVPSGRHTTRNTRFTSAQGTRWTSAPTVNNRTKGESYRWRGCEGKMQDAAAHLLYKPRRGPFVEDDAKNISKPVQEELHLCKNLFFSTCYCRAAVHCWVLRVWFSTLCSYKWLLRSN